MTRLVDALRTLQLEAQIELAGRWVELDGRGCTVYVVEAAWGHGYYTWCSTPQEQTVEFYTDPYEAIRAGLRRAAKHE